MLRIGIAKGKHDMFIYEAIKSMCYLSSYGEHEMNIQIIDCNNCYLPWDILILNSITPCHNLRKALLSIKEGGLLMLNSDEKNQSRLQLQKPVRLITYGFNSKSCITASSVLQSEYTIIQCCIQRGFSALNGEMLEPQEFSVSLNDKTVGVHAILAAAATALLCGVKAEELDHSFLLKTKL